MKLISKKGLLFKMVAPEDIKKLDELEIEERMACPFLVNPKGL